MLTKFVRAQRDALHTEHELEFQGHRCRSSRLHSLAVTLGLHGVSFTQTKLSSLKLNADPLASVLGRKHKDGRSKAGAPFFLPR